MAIEMKSVANVGGTERREIIFDGRETNTLADLFHNDNWLRNLSYLTYFWKTQ
jgi:hypothetical protein